MFKLIVAATLLGCALSVSTYCPAKQVYDSCGSPCPKTCENVDKQVACTSSCLKGCRCKDGLLTAKDKNGTIIDCITRDQCPDNIHPCEAPLEWQSCGSSCTRTCQNPSPACFSMCTRRCQCPFDSPVQDIDYYGCIRCVKEDKCCPAGKVFHPCAPSCPRTCPYRNIPCQPYCQKRCVCPKDKPIEVVDAAGKFLRCVRSTEECPQ